MLCHEHFVKKKKTTTNILGEQVICSQDVQDKGKSTADSGCLHLDAIIPIISTRCLYHSLQEITGIYV